MKALKLRSSLISIIIDDPTLLQPLLSGSNATSLDTSISSSDITPEIAAEILTGYTSGFSTLFILNASLSAVSVIVSMAMIRHKELTRGDEEEMRRLARENSTRKSNKEPLDEIEMGDLKQ